MTEQSKEEQQIEEWHEKRKRASEAIEEWHEKLKRASEAMEVALVGMRQALATVRVPRKARVILFKPSGKYYTEGKWRIPEGAIDPYDMIRSPDFRRIDGGAVLVEAQEPWGFPHLFPGEAGDAPS